MTDEDEQPETSDGNSGPSDGESGSYPDVPPGGEEADFEEALSELEDIESGRGRLFVTAGLLFIVAVGASIIVAAEYQKFWFRPTLEKEKSIRAAIRKTDDPECRELISRVGGIADRFYALESDLKAHVPGDDLEAIRKLDRKLVTLRKDLEAAETLGDESHFRFDHSPDRVDKWFKRMYGEIANLRKLLGGQIAELAPSDAGVAGDVDAGDVGADAGGPAGKDVGESDTEWATMPPSKKRRKIVLAIHQGFERFRVWHSGASKQHPCGSAEEGETPWRPDGWSGGDVGGDI